MIIFNKYEILEKIGGGNFGTIYKSKNLKTCEINALKIEKIRENTTLNHEVKILLYLSKNDYTVSIKWYGETVNYLCLVMKLLNVSLNEIDKIDLSTENKLYIADRLIDIVSFLYSKNIIHRDIKPDNFMYNLEMNKIYIIDFGLAVNSNMKHNNLPNNIVGSPNFISLNIHNGNFNTIMDDLESLGYVMFYLIQNGKLKWRDYTSLDEIKSEKELTKNSYLEYCRNTKNKNNLIWNKIKLLFRSIIYNG
jgi:serine/threonine protein kinase